MFAREFAYRAFAIGLHGWEGRAARLLRANRAKHRVRQELARRLMLSVPGVWLEDKGLTLAIHYQSVAEEGVRQPGSSCREFWVLSLTRCS